MKNMIFDTENPIEKILDLYLNDVSGQTPAIREEQVLEAMGFLERLKCTCHPNSVNTHLIINPDCIEHGYIIRR